jgi:hypothetical protein
MPSTGQAYPSVTPDEEPDGRRQRRHIWRWVLGIVALLLIIFVVGAGYGLGTVLSGQMGTDNFLTGNDNAVNECKDLFRTVQTARDQYRAAVGVYPGGSLPRGATASPVLAPSAEGILALYGTVTLPGGQTAGPWLSGSSHYGSLYGFSGDRITVSNDGKGTILVIATHSESVLDSESVLGTTLAACGS